MHGDKLGYEQQQHLMGSAPPGSATPREDLWRRGTTIALQVGLALIVASAAGVGYYTGGRYRHLVTHGYLGDDIPDLFNSLSALNTLAALACLLVVLTTKISSIPTWLKTIAAFHLYLMISGLWSYTLLETLYSQAKVLLYISALYCASLRLGWAKVYQSVSVLTLIVCTIGLYVSYSNPEFRAWMTGDAYRGLFSHKNALGAFSLFSALFILSGLKFTTKRALPLMAFSSAALSIFMSNSKTAFAMMLISSLLYALFSQRNFFTEFSRAKNSGFVYIFATVLVSAVFAVNALYGDVSLTGRTNAWAWFISDLGSDFLFGMGGLSFPYDPAVMARAASIGYLAIDSSYIFILYNAGLLGICFFATCILTFFREVHRAQGLVALGALMLVTNYAAYGVIEANARLSTSMPTACLILMLALRESRSFTPPSPTRRARPR